MQNFPQTLKAWRNRRRYSQLELAMRADVSSRHISFLETGRARPSREMVLRLGQALDVPMAACNGLLTDAGFAAQYQRRDWQAAEMAPVRQAVAHMLASHSPYPAMTLDHLWAVVDMNPAAARLYSLLNVGPGDSLLELLLRPDLPDYIENWPQVAQGVAGRLRIESSAQGGIAALDRVADQLVQEPGRDNISPAPVIPTIFRANGMRLSLFATIAQFGTPLDLTLDDLKVELYFPADVATEQMLKAMG